MLSRITSTRAETMHIALTTREPIMSMTILSRPPRLRFLKVEVRVPVDKTHLQMWRGLKGMNSQWHSQEQ